MQDTTDEQPWLQEPDRQDWVDEASGYPCLIVRGPFGSLCGYVGVPEDHVWARKGLGAKVRMPVGWESREVGIDEVGIINLFCASVEALPEGAKVYDITLMVRCHGGLTYARPECPMSEGDTRAAWWFGFDCGHAWDRSPEMERQMPNLPPMPGAVYRTIEYVTEVCTRMALDLHDAHRLHQENPPQRGKSTTPIVPLRTQEQAE